MQQKILILFAHPMIHRSNINKALIQSVNDLKNVTIHDLYAHYPDFFIQPKIEQQLLMENDVIIFQHPFYWYSAPALLKMWQDVVLEYGFAYGNNYFLENKKLMSVITTGLSEEDYSEQSNNFSMQELLRPFENTAIHTKMNYLEPFIIHGSNTMSVKEITNYVEKYRSLLIAIRENEEIMPVPKQSKLDGLIDKILGQST